MTEEEQQTLIDENVLLFCKCAEFMPGSEVKKYLENFKGAGVEQINALSMDLIALQARVKIREMNIERMRVAYNEVEKENIDLLKQIKEFKKRYEAMKRHHAAASIRTEVFKKELLYKGYSENELIELVDREFERIDKL
jgi:hypothetical protein